MVLKPDAVQARLLRLEEVISELERLRDAELASETLGHQWAIERGLHLGAEILLDIGNHVLSAGFGVAADGYEDIIQRLGERLVLSTELHQRLAGLGGFRNLLVHDYLRLDPERVKEILSDAPEAYSAFAVTIRRWLAAERDTE